MSGVCAANEETPVAQDMHNGDLQLTNDLSAATEDETMESLTDNTAVGAPPPSHEALAGVVNLAYVANRDQTDAKPEQRHLQNCNDQKPPVLDRNHDDARNQNHRSTPATRKAPAHNAQKSLEEEKNAVNQAHNGKILNHHHNHSNHHHQIQIPDDAVINYDTARLRKSLHRGDKADMVALDVFADSTKAQEALMCVANGGAGSGGAHPQAVPVSSPLTSCSADNGTKMFEEYFIPVNTHKKFLRGEKLYLTKEKRKVCSGWKRMFFCCLLLVILGIALLVGVLAATGFLLSESKSSPKSVVRVDPSSPSMSASTLKGAPQPKETNAPPRKPPPPSPPVMVVPPVAQTTRPPPRPTTTTPTTTTATPSTTTPTTPATTTTSTTTSTAVPVTTVPSITAAPSSTTTSTPVTTTTESTIASSAATTVQMATSAATTTDKMLSRSELAEMDPVSTTTTESTSVSTLLGVSSATTTESSDDFSLTTIPSSDTLAVAFETTTMSSDTATTAPEPTTLSPNVAAVLLDATTVLPDTTITSSPNATETYTTTTEPSVATTVSETGSSATTTESSATTTLSSALPSEQTTGTPTVNDDTTTNMMGTETPTTSPEWRMPSGLLPVSVPNAVLGELTLPDEIFKDSLNNISSSEAKSLTNELKDGIEGILRKGGYRFETIDILKYRRGSVVVSFVVVSGDRYLPANKVQETIRTYVASNGGTLGSKTVDLNSIVALDATNECKLDNGDCVKSSCEWDYLSGSKSCVCLPGTTRLSATACTLPATVPPGVPATDVDESTTSPTLPETTRAAPTTTSLTTEAVTTADRTSTTLQDATLARTETLMTDVPTTATPSTTTVTEATTVFATTEVANTLPALTKENTDGTTTTSLSGVTTITTDETLVVFNLTTTGATTDGFATETSTAVTTMVTTPGTEPNSTFMTVEPVPTTFASNFTTVSDQATTVAMFIPENSTSGAENPSEGTMSSVLGSTTTEGSVLNFTLGSELQNDTTTSEIDTTTIFIMTTGMNLNSTVDVVEMTTSNSSAASANDTWMTTLSPVLGVSFDVSTTTESNANSSESFGTIPSIMVHSQEPAATEEPTTVISSSLANTTATSTVNSTETVTTEMYSIFRDTGEDFGNSTDQSIDMNSTMLVLFNSTLMDTNETILNVTVSSTTDSPLNSTAGLELTTLFNMTESTTLPADLTNRTDTHPMFGNSTIDEMDPEVNVSNRTYSMGRNLTFMNNNTLSDDGVEVVNGTLDAWNMTANGTLLNTGNFSFSGDDDMMATEGVNMTHHGESTMDFLNETIANTTDDVFRTLCSSEEFFCSAETSHTCLKKELLCDQFEDCPGASDEENCTESCGTNFECSDGTCVMASAKCDGIRDCPNGEDEESCVIVDTQCTDLEVMCPDSSACIKPLSLCDGIYNCRDRSDESGCVDKTLCEQSNKFYCGDKLCISSALRCDGHPDCKDGEDEVNCTCDETQFQCMNGYCVSKASGPVRCNGVLDCADGSDERGCVKVDTNGVVHVLDGSTNSWVLMCADNATLHDGHQICQEMGYSHAVSTDVMRVDANTTAWASWISSGTEGDTWSGGVVSLESCNDGAFSVKCHHFECENQTEVLFRIEREATAQSSHSEVWPYLALIYGEGSDFACHAEIVSPLWLLTTAHCLQQLPQNASLLYAQAGFAKMYNTTERHPVKSVVLHPHFSQFRSKTLPDYDLALVRLKDPLAFASHTAAACLPDDVVRPGVTCFVGSFGDGRPRVPFMKAQSIIHLPVVINELATCNNDEHYKEDVSQQMICGDGRKMKRQLCDSDIGAPLMCLSPNNIWRLAGILSYQRHCGTYRKHPSVFSNIFEMRDFIDNVTGLKSYNVTHDPLLYTLVEFPQGDDSSNATAELRSYEPDKVLGSDRNASSAVAAALYSHENIFGGNFTDVNETVSEVYKISEFVSGPNATNASAVYNATESDVETTTAAAAAATLGLDAALREIDLSESTTVSVPSTTETSTESIGSPRLMDSDASVDVGVTAVDVNTTVVDVNMTVVDVNMTVVDVNVTTQTNGAQAGNATLGRLEHMIADSIVTNRSEMVLASHERNDAEETTSVPSSTATSIPTSTTTNGESSSTTMTPATTVKLLAALPSNVTSEMRAVNESSTLAPATTEATEATTTLEKARSDDESEGKINSTETLGATPSATTPVPFQETTPFSSTLQPAATTEMTVNDTVFLEPRRSSNGTECMGFECKYDKRCIEKTLVCDGSYDCVDASDETSCIRLDEETRARIRGGDWTPICGEAWNDTFSDFVCQEAGYGRASETTIIALDSPYETSLTYDGTLIDEQNHRLLHFLKPKNGTCVTKVVVKCMEFQCGSWDSADRNASTSNTANGTVIHAGEKRWPAIGLLTSNDGQCIASVLSPHWLLTSWSCMSRSTRGSEASSWVLTLQRPAGKDPYASFNYSIGAVLPSPVSNATDLALVRVQSTLELGDGIEAICLSEKKPEQGHLCVTAGWPRNQSDHTNHLSFMPVSVVPWSVCEDSNATGLRTGDGSACASFSEKENALCQKGSGAPLMCFGEHGLWKLHGVSASSSVRQACSVDDASLSVAYTLVDSVLQWAKDTLAR
ncbi:uncharacterized protein LOC120838375 [Ixodes scapularis]|uniref:uncharacterized protein LOC120838375 n=1 Tax=Ixodes scapularis TaxID=6945 RepID=UPI001C388BA9|nr:uncharacterized protein LOC120838375 [Ixodes scapularis]